MENVAWGWTPGGKIYLTALGVLSVAVVLSNAQTDVIYDNGSGSRFFATSENKNPWTSLAPNVAADQFQFASVPLKGDGAIMARYVPQTPSQFAKMGLMMREATAPDSRYVALLITPQGTKDIETPHWHLELSIRAAPGTDAAAMVVGPALAAPFVTWTTSVLSSQCPTECPIHLSAGGLGASLTWAAMME